MVRNFVFIIFILVFSIIFGYQWVKTYPQRSYKEILLGNKHDYFKLNKFYLKPVQYSPVLTPKEDYPQLWRNFHFGEFELSIPIRHPFYQVVPQLFYKGKNNFPYLVVDFRDNQNISLLKLSFMGKNYFNNHLHQQELFKFPYIKNIIKTKPSDSIWLDMFQRNIPKNFKSNHQAIMDLYLLHLRQNVFGSDTLDFYFLDDRSFGLVEKTSPNKDYSLEEVQYFSNNEIYKFVIATYLLNPDAANLRNKLIQNLIIKRPDTSLSDVFYQEFKNLSYEKQISSVGMLYLLCSWLQDPSQSAYFEEMITYLEKDAQNLEVLNNFYEFSFKNFGKTYARNPDLKSINPDIELQRRIEIEQYLETKEILRKETNLNQPKLNKETITPQRSKPLKVKKSRTY